MSIFKRLAVFSISLSAVLLCLLFTSCSNSEEEHVHNWLPASCTEPKTCRSCGAKEDAALGHTNVILPAIEPTCGAVGYEEGVACSTCGAVITAQKEIPKLDNHSYINGTCKDCAYECPHTGASETYCSICEAGVIDYKITVTDDRGVPQEYVSVYVYRAGDQVAYSYTLEDGTASLSLLAATYTFELDSGSDYTADERACVIKASDPEINVVLYNKEAKNPSYDLMFGFEYNGENTANEIYVGESYLVDFTSDKCVYFVFVPDQTGIYRVSIISDTDAKVGYYGTPHYVQNIDLTNDSNRLSSDAIKLSINPALVAGDGEKGSPHIIGVNGISASGRGVLKIERIADYVMTFEDLHPIATPYEPDLTPEDYIPEGFGSIGFTLTDLDITSADTSIIKSEKDGFYHYMTEDGPIVLIKLDIDTVYCDALSKMCEIQDFMCYIYDENGEPTDKVSYRTMLLNYVKACSVDSDRAGVYPLDDHLITAVKNVGNHRGWFDLSAGSNTHIFNEDRAKINPENAWMFVLCYAEISSVDHRVVVKNSDGKAIVDVNVTVTDDEGNVIASARTDSNGIAAMNFRHYLNSYYVKFDTELSEDYVIESRYTLEGTTLKITLAAVVSDGGESINGYDPSAKYALYNWKTANLKVQINEHSSSALSSNYKRFLAGETLNEADVDTLIRLRNSAMADTVKANIEYVYKTDTDVSYSFGSAGETITAMIFSQGSSAPDIFCDSIYDLIAASLKGCFFNLLTQSDENNFSFCEPGFKSSGESFGYMEELMDSLSFSPAKRYILASDFLIDTIRALSVVPVNLSILGALPRSAIGADESQDDPISMSDLHSAVMSGKWDYQMLIDLCSAVDDESSQTCGIIFNTASEDDCSVLLYSTNIEMFTRTVDKENGTYICEFLNTGTHFSEFSALLCSLLDCSGISVEKTDDDDITKRFLSGGLLFGGIIPLGSVMDDEYSTLSAQMYIAPVPKYESASAYKTILDSSARLAALNAKCENLAVATAYLDYQSTHSSDISDAYVLYELLYGRLGASAENKEAVSIIKTSFAPSYAKVYDDAVTSYFKAVESDLTGCSFPFLFSSSDFQLSDAEDTFIANMNKRQKYIEMLIKAIDRLD